MLTLLSQMALFVNSNLALQLLKLPNLSAIP